MRRGKVVSPSKHHQRQQQQQLGDDDEKHYTGNHPHDDAVDGTRHCITQSSDWLPVCQLTAMWFGDWE